MISGMATRRRQYTPGKQNGKTWSSNCSNSTSTSQRISSDQKEVPNYLKPTVCSSNEAVKTVKKSGHEDASQRPNVHRRRSFDKPSTARVQIKEHVSPGQDKHKTYRPTMNFSKPTTIPKTSLETVVGKPNGAKTNSTIVSTSRSLKKTPTSTPTNKKGNASWRLKKTTKSEDKREAQRLESKHENEDNLGHDQVVKDEHQQVDADDSELLLKAEDSEQQGDILVHSAEAEIVEEGKDKVAVDSTVPEEHNVAETEESENKDYEETPADHTHFDEDKENDESKDEETKVEHDHEEDITKEEIKTEAEEKGEDMTSIAAEEVAATAEDGEEKLVENSKEEEEEEKRQHVDESSQEQEESVEGLKADSGDVVEKSQPQVGVGNKESPTESSYNDMIEKTASKLHEERKNKVQALVGAFETVIDKETSNSMM